jgi:hypothetical protein
MRVRLVQAEAARALAGAEAAHKRAEVRVGVAPRPCSVLLVAQRASFVMALCRRACACLLGTQEQARRAAEAEAARKREEVCARVGRWGMLVREVGEGRAAAAPSHRTAKRLQ